MLSSVDLAIDILVSLIVTRRFINPESWDMDLGVRIYRVRVCFSMIRELGLFCIDT